MNAFRSPVLKSTVKYSLRRLSKGRTTAKPYSFSQYFLELKLKFTQNRIPLLVSFIVWLSGYIYYYFLCPKQTMFQILLISFTIRTPTVESDLSRFYELCWPIFLEVVIFGFTASALLDQYNPVVICRLTSERQTGHTLVVGHAHLGERIVTYLRLNHKPYVVLEETDKLVEDLINNREPVVLVFLSLSPFSFLLSPFSFLLSLFSFSFSWQKFWWLFI